MKRLLFLLTPLLTLLLLPAADAAELKIGHVDLQRVVAQSDAGKQAHESFAARNKKFQDEITARADALKKIKEDLEAAVQKLPKGQKLPQALVDKDKEYGAQARELQRMLDGYNQELKVYDAELSRKVLEEFQPILAEFAEKQGYDYILRISDSMVFAHARRDLTEQLIKAFNQKRKK